MKGDRPYYLQLALAEAYALQARVGPPEPPTGLEPDTFADRLYDALGPLATLDPQAGWSLLIYVNAIGTMYQLVEDWVRDTPDGPGWSLLLDVNRAPDEALAWLAQLAGVRLFPGATPDENRARIISTDGFRRGTREAMIGAAQATLTGRKFVLFRERDHDPADTPDYAYYLTVSTYANETPDPAATLAALLAQKPGGIVMTYRTQTGQTWQQVKDDFATWADVKAHYPDWASVRADEPG